jgi:phytanoyl-CoA hydroxylase
VLPQLESYRVLFDVDEGVRCIKQLVDMDKMDDFFHDMLQGGKARSLASALLGEQAEPQSLEYFDKGPRIGPATPPHQDGFYFCLKPNHAVTLWVGLDAFDAENGCVSYVTGSHRGGVIDHRPSGIVGFSQGLGEDAFRAEHLFEAQGKAGDCYAHHSLTIHLAGANRSDRHRRSLGIIYYGASAKRDEVAFARYQASVASQRKAYPQEAIKT